MPLRRFGRPGLIGLAARTAVVAGTAGAVGGAMSRYQQQRAQQEYEQEQYEAAQRQAQEDSVLICLWQAAFILTCMKWDF